MLRLGFTTHSGLIPFGPFFSPCFYGPSHSIKLRFHIQNLCFYFPPRKTKRWENGPGGKNGIHTQRIRCFSYAGLLMGRRLKVKDGVEIQYFISSFHLFIGSIRIGGKSLLMDPIWGYLSLRVEMEKRRFNYSLLILQESSIISI